MRVMILPYPLEELRLENKTNSCGFRLCCIHVLLLGHSCLKLVCSFFYSADIFKYLLDAGHRYRDKKCGAYLPLRNLKHCEGDRQ